MIYKQYNKTNIEQHDPHLKPVVYSDAVQG